MKIEILQGISGAGKSTYADSRKEAIVCSADYFWRGAKMQPHLLPTATR
jgi:predicted kinase